MQEGGQQPRNRGSRQKQQQQWQQQWQHQCQYVCTRSVLSALCGAAVCPRACMMLAKLNTWPQGVIWGHAGGLSSEMGQATGLGDAMSTRITSSQSNIRSASASNARVSTEPAGIVQQDRVCGR